MKEEEIRRIWTNAEVPNFPVDAVSITRLRSEVDRLDKVIRQRDRREIGTAALIAFAFGGMGFWFDDVYTKAGCILIVLASFLIVWVLRKSRKRETKAQLPIREHVEAELFFYRKQRRILKNVSTWYISPIFAGLTLFYLGLVGSWTEFVGFTFINLGVMIFVVYLNRQAIRKEIDPLIASLEKLQLNLENE
jgi:protein-S-isoprenylcysteine O-methyltransferase Ste14